MSTEKAGTSPASSRVGQRWVYDKQEFACEAGHWHTTKDGREVWLNMWFADCLECGERFGFYSPCVDQPFKHPTRRCEAHRKPLRRREGAKRRGALPPPTRVV